MASIAEQRCEPEKKLGMLPVEGKSEFAELAGLAACFSRTSGHSEVNIPSGRKYQYDSGLIKIHNGESSYQCPWCGQNFQQKHHLDKHQTLHAGGGSGDYSDNWDRPPIRSSNLIQYQSNHTCPECGESFNHKKILIRHLVTHTGKRPYACSQCKKAFTQSVNLRRHQRIHTGEKPHSCLQCGKNFSRKDSLLDHLRTHIGKKAYECPECGKGFPRPRLLIAHRKSH